MRWLVLILFCSVTFWARAIAQQAQPVDQSSNAKPQVGPDVPVLTIEGLCPPASAENLHPPAPEPRRSRRLPKQVRTLASRLTQVARPFLPGQSLKNYSACSVPGSSLRLDLILQIAMPSLYCSPSAPMRRVSIKIQLFWPGSGSTHCSSSARATAAKLATKLRMSPMLRLRHTTKTISNCLTRWISCAFLFPA